MNRECGLSCWVAVMGLSTNSGDNSRSDAAVTFLIKASLEEKDLHLKDHYIWKYMSQNTFLL